MSRPKYSVYIATSIDGYIARQNGDVSWLECVSLPNEDYGYEKFFTSIDAVILGRHSYEKALGYDTWPYQGKKVIVLSNTLRSVKEGSELFSSELSALNAKLLSQGINHAYVDGGVTTSHFLNAKLIDHMIISIVPVLLGSGIRLFNRLYAELNCRLITSKEFPSGLIQLEYDVIYQ